MALKLNFACGNYDRMDALKSGEVAPEGIDLEFLGIDAPREIFDRMMGENAFDVSELSSSEFISMTAAGDRRFVAIPVFPSKAFRHGFFCINRNAGIASPKDLEGKRVGVPLYTQTAAVWCRGHLAEDYGVDLSTVEWVQGAVEKVGTHGTPSAPALLKPARVVQNETGRSLSDMLADGEIDALLGSRLPESLRTHPDVVRLFPDFREVEKELYRTRRIHPIMHLVAIKREIHEERPWIAKSLYGAFESSKALALERMRISAAQRYMLPFLVSDLEEIDEIFDDGDPWPYGVEPNRATLEALVRYLHDQDFIAEAMPIESLFVSVEG